MMEILAEISGDEKKLKVKGRLDGYWADHLAKALEEEIHRGSHRLLLDASAEHASLVVECAHALHSALVHLAGAEGAAACSFSRPARTVRVIRSSTISMPASFWSQ